MNNSHKKLFDCCMKYAYWQFSILNCGRSIRSFNSMLEETFLLLGAFELYTTLESCGGLMDRCGLGSSGCYGH